MNKKQIMGLIIAAALFIATGVASVAINTWSQKKLGRAEGTLKSALESVESTNISLPKEDYIAVVKVEGTIAESEGSSSLISSSGYSHSFTLDYIKKVTEDNIWNKGILLVVDSPGGSVYTSDELYYALMDYKKATNRPIYCYFGSYACSGGYYISMAADEIYANRNTWTGSIGVISQMYDLTGLYDKLGIKEVDIVSGRNKAMGSSGQSLTEEQHKIMQSLVDEAYEQFVGIVAEGRGMPADKVKEIADGRVVSASQAQQWNLIDGISRYEDYQAHIREEQGKDVDFYVPEVKESILFSLFSKVQSVLPKSDTEVMTDFANTLKRGLWYYAE